MNEKIVILGNGFDLRHFLPTKYNHLITILREIESLDFSTYDEIKFDTLFGNLFIEKDEWFHKEMCNHYNIDQIIFEKDSLISIQERLKNNNWFKYLKTVEDSKIETWIDFETEIERVLKIMLDYFENFNSTSLQRPKYGNLDRGNCFYSPNYEHENYFSNRLQLRTLVNFGLYEFDENYDLNIVNDNFILNIDDEIQYFKEKDFFDSLYISLEDFTGIFNDYIIKVVNKFYRNFKDEKKEGFILKKNGTILFNNIQKIFSFNYTETIFELYKYKDNIDNVINLLSKDKKTIVEFIHGEAIKSWEDLDVLKIVLGVSEIEGSLKNHKLFQFTKYFQKLHKNTDYLFLENIIKDLNQNYNGLPSYTFYFWGHSLDSSD